jgi:hypothetical protein
MIPLPSTLPGGGSTSRATVLWQHEPQAEVPFVMLSRNTMTASKGPFELGQPKPMKRLLCWRRPVTPDHEAPVRSFNAASNSGPVSVHAALHR